MSDTVRSAWTSRLGFILASAGAAVGLGAIWKFPYLTGSNGGSAFLFPYLLISVTLGLTLLIAEIALGRRGQGCIVTAYRSIGGKKWTVWGYLGIITGFGVLCFYSTIGGWTLSYLTDSVTSLVGMESAPINERFVSLTSGIFAPIAWQAAFLALTALVVARDLNAGIERFSKVLMPVFFVLVVILIVRGVTLPGAEKGLAYLFTWSPEAFTRESLLSAMGFTFFSLCIGCGCMLTYGSYLPRNYNLVSGCTSIVLLTSGASILGGLMIMPAVFASGLNPAAGPGLTFMTMPAVFAQMPAGSLFAVAFFACLVCAALTSAVSLMEIVAAFLVDELHMKRTRACAAASAAMLAAGIPCTLSFGPLADVKLAGRNYFDWFDFFTSNVSLPVGGLIVCILTGYVAWSSMKNEITEGSAFGAKFLKLFRVVLLVACPLLILTVLINGLI